MHRFVTILTAAAMLWHTLVGCCAHAHADSCTCEHATAMDEAAVHDRDHAGHNDSESCAHAHEAIADASEDAAPLADESGEGRSHEHPCRCHCDGNRCVAVATSTAWEMPAPRVAFDVLPPLSALTRIEVVGANRTGGGQRSALRLALPLRAHLYFQILLI